MQRLTYKLCHVCYSWQVKVSHTHTHTHTRVHTSPLSTQPRIMLIDDGRIEDELIFFNRTIIIRGSASCEQKQRTRINLLQNLSKILLGLFRTALTMSHFI
ncbi:hypothetical protein AMELA_G00037560 [Ameiurus melas]|uniref:Uncharacterized protein n=1 Tax=Ameiurus melas TaxID=219545 RepID=A0A7J6B953_AMEME|nr:hypothetical protein AMELA_G00037560 [Ameiurus melas]